MTQLHCHQHFEINRLSLKIIGNNIALNGLQKVKSIQCYTRQIMSKLGQRKQISNRKGSLVN